MKVSNVVLANERIRAIFEGNCSALLVPAGGSFEGGRTPADLMMLPKAERAKFCRVGEPGDVLWCQEPWLCKAPDGGDWSYLVYGKLPPPGNIEAVPSRYQSPDFCLYQATHQETLSPAEEIRWAPAKTQPRWASRLYLKLWDVDLVPLSALTDAEVQLIGQSVPDDKTPLQVFTNTLVQAFGEDVLRADLHLWFIQFRRMDLHFARREFTDLPDGVPPPPGK